MDQRRQFIMSNRLCLKCGQEGHNSRECATTNRCHICGRNHVSFLCYQRTTIHRRTETDRSVNNQSRSSTAAEPVATSSQPSLLIQNGRSMHKTLVTEINGETVRVVFDEGASSSFVSSRLAEKWNIEKIRAEPIFMDTLSNTGPTMTGHLMIKVKIPTWGGRHKELGFRINDKVDKLKFECIDADQQEYIRRLKIDFKDEQRPVEMLIGLDNINQIQLAEERRLSKNVMAKRTTIGWVVYGVSKTTNVLLNLNQSTTMESTLDVDVETGEKVEKFIDDHGNNKNVEYSATSKKYDVKLPFSPNKEIESKTEKARGQAMEMNQFEKHQNRHPQTVQAVKNGLYVDDLVLSTPTTNDVQFPKDQNKEIWRATSMEFRRWRSSDETLNQLWSDGLAENEVLRIESESDNMKVMMPEFESRRTTKQTLLQHQSIDDLFGGALASTLKLRSLIYKIWTMKYDWNDELEESLRNKVQKAMSDIDESKSFELQQRILDDHELSKFVSANQDAIDAVCYLSNQNQISFTYAESKLIKPTKIVSGELLVFTVGENISQTVLEILHLKRTMVRSDSMDNVKRLEDDINKSYRLKLTEIVNEQPISIMMQVTKNGSKEKGFDIARWDLTTKRSYQSWEELVQKQSDEWKKSIYDNNDELTILIKLHQQQFIDEQFEKTKLWFHDESGLAWCLTRLERMELEYNEKYPIVWPTCEHNKAFVRCLHQNDEHGSVTYSLSNLSLKHFVLGAQQLLITIKKRCAKYRQISIKLKVLQDFMKYYKL
ncbi:hypothetical protein DERP_003667 [Dermatophagoides pteronyssinus]|uniref:CCHC-type domain-containing protein n=1 Tax=Dermatophagoides pteronyssinus TaxID=6956 RepID=A0ABQ8JLB4_DERPT|nr:hypothetical protein DERP_003667 [Dermatophagoides pteronyssinus]